MCEILQNIIFALCFKQILLICFSNENTVTALSDRIIHYRRHSLAKKVKYFDNKGRNKYEKRSQQIDIADEDADYEMQNESLHKHTNLLNYYYIEDVVLNSFISEHPTSYLNEKIDKRIYYRHVNKLNIHRLLDRMKILFLLYLALAIPLWLTKGWSCCCLLCKSLKPNKIIEEAKMFMESNPPGVFEHRAGVIYYEPSDIEKDFYEKLEHTIRTI